MLNIEHRKKVFGSLLQMKGMVAAVADYMVDFAKQLGSFQCSYEGIPLSADRETTRADILKQFSVECVRRRLLPESGRAQLVSMGRI